MIMGGLNSKRKVIHLEIKDFDVGHDRFKWVRADIRLRTYARSLDAV